MVEFDSTSVCYFVGLLVSIATKIQSVNAAESQETIIRHLNAVDEHLNTLSRAIRSAHTDMKQRQLDECRLEMGMLAEPYCDTLNMDNSLQGQVVITDKLSPGKRSRDTNENTVLPSRKSILEDLIHKQKVLENLQTVIDGARSTIHQERKRSCNVNLGFHCQTEQYSAIADMYNWLQNSMSPGKRRRRHAEVAGSKLEQALKQRSCSYGGEANANETDRPLSTAPRTILPHVEKASSERSFNVGMKERGMREKGDNRVYQRLRFTSTLTQNYSSHKSQSEMPVCEISAKVWVSTIHPGDSTDKGDNYSSTIPPGDSSYKGDNYS